LGNNNTSVILTGSLFVPTIDNAGVMNIGKTVTTMNISAINNIYLKTTTISLGGRLDTNQNNIINCPNIDANGQYPLTINNQNGQTIINGSTQLTNLSVTQNASINTLNVMGSFYINGSSGAPNTLLSGGPSGIPTWSNSFLGGDGKIIGQNQWLQVNLTNTTYPTLPYQIGYSVTTVISSAVNITISQGPPETIIPSGTIALNVTPGVWIISYQVQYATSTGVANVSSIMTFFKPFNAALPENPRYATQKSYYSPNVVNISSTSTILHSGCDIFQSNSNTSINCYTVCNSTGPNLQVTTAQSYFRALRIA